MEERDEYAILSVAIQVHPEAIVEQGRREGGRVIKWKDYQVIQSSLEALLNSRLSYTDRANAAYRIAATFLEGKQVEKSKTTAVFFFKKAILSGHSDAHFQVAECYSTLPNTNEWTWSLHSPGRYATRWYEQVSEKSQYYWHAQYALGKISFFEFNARTEKKSEPSVTETFTNWWNTKNLPKIESINEQNPEHSESESSS